MNAICAGCGRPRDEKGRCWKCQDRPCCDCGRLTGSAFIEQCNRCARLDEIWDAAIGNKPPVRTEVDALKKERDRLAAALTKRPNDTGLINLFARAVAQLETALKGA